MRNAEWLTLTLIEATLVEATLVWITHRLRRFANVR
jgi:ABC-type transport system involved in cytochrome bd biosynthesis fused ATPase/permease subunit